MKTAVDESWAPRASIGVRRRKGHCFGPKKGSRVPKLSCRSCLFLTIQAVHVRRPKGLSSSPPRKMQSNHFLDVLLAQGGPSVAASGLT